MGYFRFLSCFILMILPFQGFSQRTAFEKKYAAVRSELLATNYEEALRIADSLEQISTTETTKIRSKSLLALVHQSVGTYSIAINYAKQADQLSDLVGLSDFEASSALVLASIYRDIGIQEEVSRYIQRAKDNINSVKDSLVRNQLDIWVLQEEAYQYIHNKRYADALDCMNQAINKKGYIDFKNPRSLLIRSKNYLIIAQCHKEMGNYEESLTYLKMVMDEVYGFEHIIKPFTFQFLADVYFNLGQLENARKYLDLVIPYITGSNNLHLKKEYFFLEAKYQRKIARDDLAIHFVDKYNQIEEQKRNSAQIIGNNILREQQQEIKSLKRNNVILIWTIVISISVFVLFYMIKVRPKSNKNEAISNDLFPSMENSNNVKATSKELVNNLDVQISLETETRLVKKLNDLEDDHFFLNKNITLGWLSNKLNSNQKYISYVIRKYKNQHFNDYILNLRIQYIVQQLESNKTLLDYKLSYLADMAGFTSHSKFTLAFKSVMDTTPSLFIENLKQKSFD